MIIDISSNETIDTTCLDAVARSVLGNKTVGVSVMVGLSRIHITDASDQSTAETIFNNWGSLTVTADKTVMDEGDADPVVTCNDASISSDSDVNYIVLLDGDVYASGTTTVTAGEATLNLVSPVDGVYEIFMYRTTGNYASGSVTITVSEV